MKKWNDYCESMDPKKKNPRQNQPIDVTCSASVKYFSVYPKKAAEHNHGIPMQQSKPNANHSSSERYTNRSTEFCNVSNGADGSGHTNFAWVD